MFENVFNSYPDIDRIYAVGNMPFLTEREARNYARSQNAEVETVLRGATASAQDAPAQEGNASRSSGKPSRKTK